jgi:hypothetical protein
VLQEGPGISTMGLADCGHCRHKFPRRLLGVPGRVGLWPPAPRPAHGIAGGGRSNDLREQGPATNQLLEDLGRRLARAFQPAVASRGSASAGGGGCSAGPAELGARRVRTGRIALRAGERAGRGLALPRALFGPLNPELRATGCVAHPRTWGG